MMKQNKKMMSHKGSSSKVLKRGLGLVSLDSNHTNEYNYDNDELYSIQLCSFKGIDFSHKGSSLMANTLRQLYNKSTNSLKSFRKSLTIAVFALSFSFNLAFASDATSTEDFFYQRGYENGYLSGYEKGVEEAFKEAKSMLKNYANELKAYELGKYLIKNQNLTYPQVWQEIDDSGLVKLRVLPSRIEKELSIDELFAKFASIPTRNASINKNLELSIEEQNSVQLSYRDGNINSLPQKANTAQNKQTLSIAKSSKNLEILKKANVVFSDEGSFYNVLFFTKVEKEAFCSQFEICK
ncbi:hypothetical protein M4P98_001727 [Campylobacter upsaliensis]|nr:hypothetical protein [Campylobacter upsaliensis]